MQAAANRSKQNNKIQTGATKLSYNTEFERGLVCLLRCFISTTRGSWFLYLRYPPVSEPHPLMTVQKANSSVVGRNQLPSKKNVQHPADCVATVCTRKIDFSPDWFSNLGQCKAMTPPTVTWEWVDSKPSWFSSRQVLPLWVIYGVSRLQMAPWPLNLARVNNFNWKLRSDVVAESYGRSNVRSV